MAAGTSTGSPTTRHEAMLIDGVWGNGRAKESITVLNPANRQPIASVPPSFS